MAPFSLPPGRLVGERRAEAPVPGLVPLRALPSTPRRRPALTRRHAGGEAVRHRGTGRPRLRNLHPGFGPLPATSEHQVGPLDSQPLRVVARKTLTSSDRTLSFPSSRGISPAAEASITY